MLTNINLYYDFDFQEDIQEEWFIQLDTTIRTKPQFVQNHFTKEKMIIVQTNSNMIYALNSEGETIWKKLIDSEIIGRINSIDVYKNNKYQCLFNTNNEIHIIDRNGEYVDGFPLKLDFNTSLSHSLFDYNNKKKYRIRMAPTLLVFLDGTKEDDFKAGLDLECPVTLEELQESIDEAKKSSQF